MPVRLEGTAAISGELITHEQPYKDFALLNPRLHLYISIPRAHETFEQYGWNSVRKFGTLRDTYIESSNNYT